MKFGKTLAIGIIGGIAISLISGLFSIPPEPPPGGAMGFGLPVSWLFFHSIPFHPWGTSYPTLLIDMVFWFVVIVLILTLINHRRKGKNK
jgi:hypothetical protein